MPIVEDSHYEVILSCRHNSGVFVETGTALGVTAEYMADKFDKVYTIEYDPELYWSAFGRLDGKPNVSLIHGDSAEYLRKLDYLIPIRSTIFLDAHSVDNPDSPVAPSGFTPVVEELDAVLNIKQHVVIVDDARLFDGSHYPTMDWVTEFAEERYFKTRVVGDIIVLEHEKLGVRYG